MDFIDWCHHILEILEKEKHNRNIDENILPKVIFGEEFSGKKEFHSSKARDGMFDALDFLADVELVENSNSYWKITPLGKKVLLKPIEFWSNICQEELEPEEEQLLRLVNRLSQKSEINPAYVWIEEDIKDEILENFKKETDDLETLETHIDNLELSLVERDFLNKDDHYYPKPTYKGLVWDTRRSFTIESKLIDGLVKDWETTNVDFKQEINLKTNEQKAKFAKVILGLATTKSSGKRYMIIGFEDKTREYFAPPNPLITQDIMEQHLANLTDPIVNIRYEIIDYQKGKVGKLEVIREPEKLLYKAKKDVFDEKCKKCLEKDKIYVRHGSHTESPSEIELKMLEEEGKRTRGES